MCPARGHFNNAVVIMAMSNDPYYIFEIGNYDSVYLINLF